MNAFKGRPKEEDSMGGNEYTYIHTYIFIYVYMSRDRGRELGESGVIEAQREGVTATIAVHP